MNSEAMLLSSVDAENLTDLLEGLKLSYFPDQDQIDVLERTLENAEVLPPNSIPAYVIRVDCVVDVVDLRTGKKARYTIVLPELADMAKRLVSVTAPLGIALLGRREGEVVQVKVPGGERLLKVKRVRQWERSVLPKQQFCRQCACR